jgi:hypothetical protein
MCQSNVHKLWEIALRHQFNSLMLRNVILGSDSNFQEKALLATYTMFQIMNLRFP